MKAFIVVDKGCLDIVIIFIRLGQQWLIKAIVKDAQLKLKSLYPFSL
jgi:hypothetical protein